MSKDSERWNICLTCVKLGTKKISRKSFKKRTLDHIGFMIHKDREWTNPFGGYLTDLCQDCKFKLEHMVVNNDDVKRIKVDF